MSLPLIIGRALKTKLHAVWVKANWDELPEDGFIFAVNHHSWWDVYLAYLIHRKLKRRVSAMMDDEQLNKFRFFRTVGAVGRKEIREAIRRIKRGDMFFLFPEGELRQNGKVKHLEKGVGFLAKASKAPVYPLAFRVVMRGAQFPEAFIVLGEKLELSHTDNDLETIQSALNDLLDDIDAQVTNSNPEIEPEGFVSWLSGQESTSESMNWIERFWS